MQASLFDHLPRARSNEDTGVGELANSFHNLPEAQLCFITDSVS